MRRWAFVFLGAALLVPGVALADGNGPECKEIIARVVEITGASFDRLSPSGVNVFLRHPLSKEMVLSCPNHAISVSWDKNAYPDNAWFAFAAKAGFAVTGVEPKRIEAAIRLCHRRALKDDTETDEVEIPNAKIECQASTEDGGGVSVDVWMNDHEARKGVEEP